MSLGLLVVGAGGLLGTDVLRAVAGEGDCFARGLTRAQLDVTDPFAVRDVVRTWARVLREDGPHRLVVVNAAGWTDVEGAEDAEDAAYAVNAAGPALLAAACAEAGAGLVHLSTDYVFAGDADRPYDVDDPVGPLSAYGRTKLAGERAVREVLPEASWVVRTSWLYRGTGRDFVTTMTGRARDGQVVQVVDDQHGSPTWSRHLAGGLLELARTVPPAGILHATGGGATTWWGLARAVYEGVGADPGLVQPTSTSKSGRKAPRPLRSVLSDAAWRAAGLTPLPPWERGLDAALGEAGPWTSEGGRRPSPQPAASTRALAAAHHRAAGRGPRDAPTLEH